MAHAIDTREISSCTCRRARRAGRQLTQIYDRALEPSGLTANQFDLLANLFGASLSERKSLPIGVLAARIGMHPTTLTRDLRPLVVSGFVADADDASDRRIRGVLITGKGRDKLRKAVPFWRLAQRRVEKALGAEAARALNDLLDAASARLDITPPPRANARSGRRGSRSGR
jgi:DNA-binding MarR family transcriptional regulator